MNSDDQCTAHVGVVAGELPVVEGVLEPVAHTDVTRAEQREVVVPFHV